MSVYAVYNVNVHTLYTFFYYYQCWKQFLLTYIFVETRIHNHSKIWSKIDWLIKILILLFSKDALVKSDIKYIYNVTKDLYFKYVLLFWTFYPLDSLIFTKY